MDDPLVLVPNPLCVPKSVACEDFLHIDLVNNTKNRIHFRAVFDDESFSLISPITGEVKPESEIRLKIRLEDIEFNDPLYFDVYYLEILENFTLEQEKSLLALPEKWNDKIVSQIKFTESSKNNIQNVAFLLKSLPTLEQIIAREDNRDIDKERRELLERKADEKDAIIKKKQEELAKLQEMIKHEKEEIRKLTDKQSYDLIWVGLAVFFFSFTIKKVINWIL